MTVRRARRHVVRVYRRANRHPVGRWALWLVWIGLGLMTMMCAIYIPIQLERRDVLRAAGCLVDPR